MINKSSDILYLFDFDGTLFGDIKWDGYWKNTWKCITGKPYRNPNDMDMRWCILTGRPIIDRPIIWFVCHSNGLHPEQIFTYDHWFHGKNRTRIDTYQFKLDFIKKILDQKEKVNYTLFLITKVYYIDADSNCITYMNTHKANYDIMALTPYAFDCDDLQFINGKF